MIYSKLPVVFLGLLSSEPPGSTNSVIASYILDHLDQMKNMGIQEFAKDCNVSMSSISRFCREIGLENFAELKIMLNQSMQQQSQKVIDGSFADRKREYVRQTENGIESAAESLQEGDLQDLIDDLVRYQNAAAFGLMKAETAAIILQSDLLMYGKKIFTNMSFREQSDYIQHAGRDQLILLFSFTGSYFDYSSSQSFLKKKERPRIWMITGSHTEVPPFVYRVLRFSSKQSYFEHPSQLDFTAVMIAQEYYKRISGD